MEGARAALERLVAEEGLESTHPPEVLAEVEARAIAMRNVRWTSARFARER